MATINGGSGDDTLNGTSGNDTIVGGAGQAVVHAGQLGDAVHQFHHVRTKAPFDLVQGNAAIFDYVMEQRGDDGVGVQVEVGEEEGGFQGVGDVRLAGFPGLPSVAFVGVDVCLPHKFGAVLGQVSADPLDKGLSCF
mgnify:CR=1 FL=1